jgi:hypothetical protein
MKKLLVVLLLALAGGGVYAYSTGVFSPGHRACAKFVELCGKGSPGEVDTCEKELAELDKISSSDATGKFADCVDDVNTCAEAFGCQLGAGMNEFGKMTDDMLKGMGKGLGK